MKSPFPGMDPYLEARWSDVHATLIGFLKESLQSLLPSDLRARSEEEVLLENSGPDKEEPWESSVYRGDIAVVESPRSPAFSGKEEGATAVMEPFVIEFSEAMPKFDRWVQVIDRRNGNRIVTVIEILSPWNKMAGRLNKMYSNKIKSFMRGRANIVEIDLLRSARTHLAVGPHNLPPRGQTPYLAALWRESDPRHWQAYPIPLRQTLPAIPIPLRRGDKDVHLPLQPLIDRVYAAGGHDDIDYSRAPEPPLYGEDDMWARQLIAAERT